MLLDVVATVLFTVRKV